MSVSPPPPPPPPGRRGPGRHHEFLYPHLVAACRISLITNLLSSKFSKYSCLTSLYPEGSLLPPMFAPGVCNPPVLPPLLLPPAEDPHSVPAQDGAGVGVGVDARLVEEQVLVDLHHGLDGALGPQLLHDVLGPPVGPGPRVPPAHPVARHHPPPPPGAGSGSTSRAHSGQSRRILNV